MKLAHLNYHKTEFTKKLLKDIPGVEVVNSSTFNEFTVRLKKDATSVLKQLAEKGIIGGVPLNRFYKDMKNYFLIAVTERRKKAEILKFVEALKDAINL
ncbi:putative glycine dehydrogenase (decarboxylating)subunit 1 [Candidatus Methanoperedenaceae archaeon GB50]|nr:putative glycine dehydrogenase (decarboxylating)subunit 1 [Candidatus Methanoperedenaceae archaeon GB50]